MNQPEALRLADRLTLADYYEFDAALHCPLAAAELRRLHAQRVALLEALRAAVADWDEEVSRGRWLDAARAAIKKAEEA